MLQTTLSTAPVTTPDTIKAALFDAIDTVNARYYPVNRTKTRTKNGIQTVVSQRKRVLDFDTLTKFMLTMDGGCIDKELCDAGIDASAAECKQSARVQSTSHHADLRHFE